MKCISCGTFLESARNWIKFPCPNCLDAEIGRCETCKQLGTSYVCPKCGFVGP